MTDDRKSFDCTSSPRNIGMKAIQAADFTEMVWMPFLFGVIILLLRRAVVFGLEGERR